MTRRGLGSESIFLSRSRHPPRLLLPSFCHPAPRLLLPHIVLPFSSLLPSYPPVPSLILPFCSLSPSILTLPTSASRVLRSTLQFSFLATDTVCEYLSLAFRLFH